jgi:glycosyltransferase involved in cell wall biosynthesis
VDDGSRDATAAVAREFAERHPQVRLVTLPANQGKGGAVKAGVLAANGAFVFYVDADLNISPDHVPRALASLHNGADVVAGQRSLAEYAGNERSVKRVAAGALVQVARRALALTTIGDTQCGFKGFRRQVARAIFERTMVRSFAFDVEVLFLARKLGATIVEMAVATEYREASTVVLRKHLGPMLRDIIRIRLNHLRGCYDLPRRPPSSPRR